MRGAARSIGTYSRVMAKHIIHLVGREGRIHQVMRQSVSTARVFFRNETQ